MTRRFGHWIIGAALGMLPLSGCAQMGRGTSNANTGDSQFMAFWNRQFHGQAAIVAQAQPRPEAAAPHKNEATTTESEPPPEAAAETNPPAPNLQAVPPAPPAVLDVASASAEASTVAAATLSPPRPENQSEPPDAPAPHVAVVKREPIVEALHCVINNRHSEALQLLRKYRPSTQEICLRLFPVLALMSQEKELTPAQSAILVETLESLLDAQRQHSPLAIDKACFVEEEGNSYGNYKEVPPGHAFRGGTLNRPGDYVLLYVELRNFASELKNGYYTTKLSSTVEILDQKGKRVGLYDAFPEEKKPIINRNLVHDYCNTYSFSVPSDLPAGIYTLVIQVTDKTRPEQPRVARRALEFRVTAVPARAP
jgi:hypothetical protein